MTFPVHNNASAEYPSAGTADSSSICSSLGQGENYDMV